MLLPGRSLPRSLVVGAAMIHSYLPASPAAAEAPRYEEKSPAPGGSLKEATPEAVKRHVSADVPLAVQAREAAGRTIPYIEQEGTTWIKDRKCLACHYVGYMVWSFHDAAEAAGSTSTRPGSRGGPTGQ